MRRVALPLRVTSNVQASVLGCVALLLAGCGPGSSGGTKNHIKGVGGGGGTFAGPSILFVGQVPIGTYNNTLSTFSNHEPTLPGTPRGGGLFLRTSDGKIRDLTTEAGFGESGAQGAHAIAVREPTVHWDGDKALFSMVIGAPDKQYGNGDYHWQIYEVSGLSHGALAISKVAGQPPYNNVSPFYASDDRILFTSDRPRSGLAAHYPQRDEYESDSTIAGLYSLDENKGELVLLEHSVDGLFTPSVDSFGRIVFTRWDHLQRDQQADDPSLLKDSTRAKPFTFASEDADAPTSTDLPGNETFPEARTMNDPTYDSRYAVHSFNQFFPWTIAQDGTGEETLNHVGRHELGGSYSEGNFLDDPTLTRVMSNDLRANRNFLNGNQGVFQIHEDPTHAGRYYVAFAPEFDTECSGYLMRIDGAPGTNPQDMALTLVTPAFESDGSPAHGAGYFRDPLPLSDGSLVAAHTDGTDVIANKGSDSAPSWSYAFRLRALTGGEPMTAGAFLTDGIQVDVTWWTPDVQARYAGPLWELQPVEVRKRDRPPAPVNALPSQESSIFSDLGLSPDKLRAWMASHEVALIVSRDVTQRDAADRNQPYNLRVASGASSTVGSGKVYDVTHMQMFQADLLRGYGDAGSPLPGRRVLPRPMHGPDISPDSDGIPGAVPIASDGSVAAFVPARRALAWQLVGNGAGIVRERNWVSLQAGEIRVCTACHGINRDSQTGAKEPQNAPAALRTLLTSWMAQNP